MEVFHGRIFSNNASKVDYETFNKLAKFYKKEANSGNKDAAYNYYVLLSKGYGDIKSNPPKAMKYLKKAAELGNTQAILRLTHHLSTNYLSTFGIKVS